MTSQSIRSSSKNWTLVSPRSSAALTESIVGALAEIAAPATGDAQASVGAWSSNAPPGVAWICTFSQLGEIVSSVSASTVSVPPLQITVSGEPSRELIVSSCEAPSRTSAPSPPVMIALARLHGQPVGASVAGDRDRLRASMSARPRRSRHRCRSGRSRPRTPSLRSPSSENVGDETPAVRRGVDAVAADHRVGAGVGLQDRRCRRRRGACRRRRSRRSCRRPRPPSMLSPRAPPASTSLPSPPLIMAGIVVRPKRNALPLSSVDGTAVDRDRSCRRRR